MPHDLQVINSSTWNGDDAALDGWEPFIDLSPAEPGPGGAGERAVTPAPHAAVRSFRGNLETVGTLELLKSLTLARASGIVSFETSPEGGVLFEDGLIVAASWGQLSGAPAVAELLRLASGCFRVGAQVREVVPGDPRAPQALLLEALELVARRPASEPAPEIREPWLPVVLAPAPALAGAAASANGTGAAVSPNGSANGTGAVVSPNGSANGTGAAASANAAGLAASPNGSVNGKGAPPAPPPVVGRPAPVPSRSLWGMEVAPRAVAENGSTLVSKSLGGRALRGVRRARTRIFS